MQGYHESVLLKEVIEFLDVKPENWYLDGTLGDGGHTIKILEKGGKVLGLDVDPQAIERTKKRFEDLGLDKSRYLLVQGNFRDIRTWLRQNLAFLADAKNVKKQTDTEDQKFAGAIFDLGVSSLQLDSPEKGFSFMKSGPLDMRLDPNLGVKALDLVNALPRKELYELFKKMGEEKHSGRLADALVRAREIKPFETTLELSKVIELTVGRGEKTHPATRVFQALRIAVNDELGALKEGLEEMKDLMKNDGVIAVISFHSLEDRIVKNMFKEFKLNNLGEILTKKPVIPSDVEIQNNARSRSAKLRAFKFI